MFLNHLYNHQHNAERLLNNWCFQASIDCRRKKHPPHRPDEFECHFSDLSGLLRVLLISAVNSELLELKVA